MMMMMMMAAESADLMASWSLCRDFAVAAL
jgi:hypothetical protein